MVTNLEALVLNDVNTKVVPYIFPRLTSSCNSLSSHYENFPLQYTEIFLALKIEKFQLKIFDIFLIFAQNIDCGYSLEPPCRGGSNEYPQSMFWSKNKENMYTPAYPSFAI